MVASIIRVLRAMYICILYLLIYMGNIHKLFSMNNIRNFGVLSHNAEYRCANTDILFRLRFIHCVIVSPIILHCFSFSFWLVNKRWDIAEEVLNSNGFITYIMLTAKCMYTYIWLHHQLKVLTSRTFLSCTNLSQPGLFHVENYIYDWIWEKTPSMHTTARHTFHH